MQTIQLINTDLRVSRACLGTMTFGGQADEAESAALTSRALDLGINFFDTANVYNAGRSEIFLGRALGTRRKEVILATKVRGRMGDAPDESGLSRAAILRACEDSLRRLNTDFIDLYYLHQPDWDVPIEESLEAIDTLVRQGKVRYPACSNYAAWQMVEMLWIARERGYRPIAIAQPMYNLLARGIEQEYLPMTKRFGISNIVYNPLAGGILTGKQNSTEGPLTGTRFDNNKMYLDRYWHSEFFRAVDELKPLAAAEDRSLASLALNWLLHHTAAACILLGASRVTQLEENVAAFDDGPLRPATLEACDAIWQRLRGVTPKYNR